MGDIIWRGYVDSNINVFVYKVWKINIENEKKKNS